MKRKEEKTPYIEMVKKKKIAYVCVQTQLEPWQLKRFVLCLTDSLKMNM